MSDLTPSHNITLTGGRGRLARVINAHLSSAGHTVQSVSRSESDEHHSIDALFETPLLLRSDTLLHLAWSSLPITSEKQPGVEWTEDLPLLIKLLNQIRKIPAADRPHFIFFSSGGAVYGSATHDEPSRENSPCHPIGWYGQGKLAAENVIREFGRRYEIKHTILRVSNPYGYSIPNSHHKAQGIIPFLIESALNETSFSIWGDGTARKDFLHHTDFMAALEAIIARRPEGTFNLCHGQSHSIREVITLAESVTGKPIRTEEQPAHAWDVPNSRLDNAKLRSAIQWEPRVGLAEGMKRAAANLLSGHQ